VLDFPFNVSTALRHLGFVMSLQTMLLIVITILVIIALGLITIGLFFWKDLQRRTRDLQSLKYELESLKYEYAERRRDFPSWVDSSPLQFIINSAEESTGVRLTWAARQMLAIPVQEQYVEGRQPISWSQVEESVRMLVRTTREDDSKASVSRRGETNAVGIIRAFFKNFCNIPPFCEPTDGDRGLRT
jgi:hypothetical protein